MSAWAREYLSVLELDPEPPSLSALARLTERHLRRVPFENVTTLLRFRDADHELPLPDPQRLVANWAARRGGGLCYEVSRTLLRLLRELGYRAALISGTITFPNSHEAIVVEIEERSYLVDVGNGAPFFHPIPISEVVEVRYAGLRYRFRLGERARTFIQDRWMNEQWVPFCVYDLEPKSEAALHEGYVAHHTPGRGKFLSELVIVRCDTEGVVRLRNRELVFFSDRGQRVEELTRREDYSRVAGEIFDLPRLPICEALSVLEGLGVQVVSE